MSGATLRCSFPISRKRNEAALAAQLASNPAACPKSKVAQMLALAHYIEQAIDNDMITSSADAARALGMTRARMTQVMNLLLLAPVIQAKILSGTIKVSEHRLRPVICEPAWNAQVTTLESARVVQTQAARLPQAGGNNV